MAKISIIAALGKDRAIGYQNKLITPLPADLKRFRELSMGHPIIMGRKTFDSIGRVLPGRTNIVITRDEAWNVEGAVKASSIEDALEKAKAHDQQEIFVIGGGQIYTQALPYADQLYLTLIESDQEGDVFFPPYEAEFTKKTFEEKGEHEGLKYTWVNLERE
jgi:dihydrofolate reductase